MVVSRRKSPQKLLLLGLLWWSLLVPLTSGASFYGDGFVQLKATESSDRNGLRVRFRTSSSDGLLFLAAGRTVYFLLELRAGRLQLKLDFGSGEEMLESEGGTQLNDLAWHSVEVNHELNNVSMTVDKNSHVGLTLSGSDHVLSVLDGLYVGGSGSLDKQYLARDPPGFRGCMEDVFFNNHDLLSSLRPNSGFKNVYEVSLGCSPQFLATEDDPISFFSSRAYVSFSPWRGQQEAILEFVVHTSASEGIIMFESAKERDFVALEIQEGLPVAVVSKDGTKTELRSLTPVNDRKWHTVKVIFGLKSVELSVDGEMLKIATRVKNLQAKGHLFIGGVDDGTRAEVRKAGLLSVSGKRVHGGSFKGCLKNIKVNGVKLSLSKAVVTKDISVGCEPEKDPEPSLAASPTKAPRSGFHLVTPTPSLHMSTLAWGLDRRYGSNFVHLKPLAVPEGGRASLDAKHIKVLLDFKRLGIRQSQINFRIEEQPMQGQIRLDVDPDQEEHTFSMLDLWHERVMYIHGGSEEPDDFFMFSIFSSSRKQVPEYLKGNKIYRYNVTVTPTNDAPELSLPEGNLFVILENSKKCLTTDILKAKDIDSGYDNLVFSVLGNLNADAGYLELENQPGTAVTSFSHKDLEDLRVYYVHTGVRNSRIVLRVGDGEKVSNTVVLRVMAITLEYKIANNTGLEIVQGEAAMIGSQHLGLTTNAVKQVVDIRYDVIEPPQYGELQRLHSSGEWRHTDSFSQRLLEKERLRYVSTFQDIQTTNDTDYFKCKVNVAAKATTELLFSITVKWVSYTLLRNKPIQLDKVRKVTLTSDYLFAFARGVLLPEDDLYFRVLTTPKKGKILLDSSVLGKNSTFSQRNITDLRVHYALVDRPHEDTSDKFKFHLFSKHAQSQNYDFQFSIKADVNSVFMRNEGLDLQEGESKMITKDDLFAETLSTKEMFYTVISSPKHGKLSRISHSNSNSTNDNILSFSNKDVAEERIMYTHDDSETTQDAFKFIASTTRGFKPFIAEDEVGSKEATFNISVRLVNDQKPVRVVDKVFHVVKNGQRMLTSDDLRYRDDDSDFDDGKLTYARRGIPIGDLVLANDTNQRLFHFSQRDLDEKRVLFLHKGASVGRFVLFVSDGKNFVSSLLDVSAQEPFLKVRNNSGLLVQKGRSVIISSHNLSVESNLDVRNDKEVVFKVQEAPRYGTLYRNETIVRSFTRADLKNRLIRYTHNDGKHLNDHFNLTVRAKDLQLPLRVAVKVYLESHQRPPIVQQLDTLLAEEGKPVTVDESKLEVTHEDNLPSEIIFTVRKPPSHGYLRRTVEAEDDPSPVTSFTQEDVNDGRVQYMQVEPDQLNDTFVLDASNGVTEVGDVRVSVDIVPRLIPLLVADFTLKEGGVKALTEESFYVTNKHFAGVNFLFNVTEPPRHGRMESSRYPGVALSTFSRRQVELEFIYYVHDGSETLSDNFTVVANDTSLRKQSAPRTLHIQVAPVNDEPPVITNNRVLRVWVSSVTQIRPDDLRAQDLDSPPADLRFMVTPPSNGHLSLKSAPMRPVLNFTQAHIDQGQLLFVHKGAMSGGFNFQVNDGLNFSPRGIFSITAKSLLLSLEKNRPLKVFPGSTTPITQEHLLVQTNDVSNSSERVVTYNIVRQPKLGRVVTRQTDNSTVDVSSFTQDMIDREEVLYIQSPMEAIGWEALDSLSFSVKSPPSSMESQTFKIDISYQNTGPERSTVLLANTGAVVTEGGSVAIHESHLDASNLMSKLPAPDRGSHEVWFQVTSLPRHGVVSVGERNLTAEKPNFSQFIVNKYGISYKHDDSETTGDWFGFSVWVNPKGKSARRPQTGYIEERFNITVAPVNDQPPLLKTKAPGLSVVQGAVAVLTPENLKVEDLDDPPEDIVFSVISEPNNGFLALEGSLDRSATRFTQAQVDNGSVFFVHDGTPSSGVFYFSVTDGHHKPIYKLFNLEVTEIKVTLVSGSALTLDQGSRSTPVTKENLSARTNGKNSTIHYRVTRTPRFGKLLVENQEVVQFHQEDVDAGRLSYHMVQMSSQDSFEFTVFTSEVNLSSQVLNVTVAPLVELGRNIRTPNGTPVRIDAGFFNASKLAQVCDCDPVFEVVSGPRFGTLTKGHPKTSPVDSFTFQDVMREVVTFEASANMTGVLELNDSLAFVLKADHLPPARGEFLFTVVPYDPLLVRTTKTTPVTTTGLISVQETARASRLGPTSPGPSVAPVHTEQVSKNHQKYKSRNRWGNSNRTRSFGTTLGKPTPGSDYFPLRNTPVRVESYPQKTSGPLMVILPLLALLLLVVIFVVLVVFLRHHRRGKQSRQDASEGPASAPGTAYQGQPQRSAAAPTVTVTPLSHTCPNSPALDRDTTPNFDAYGSSILGNSWTDSAASSQIIRVGTPTLHKNQYWV